MKYWRSDITCTLKSFLSEEALSWSGVPEVTRYRCLSLSRVQLSPSLALFSVEAYPRGQSPTRLTHQIMSHHVYTYTVWHVFNCEYDNPDSAKNYFSRWGQHRPQGIKVPYFEKREHHFEKDFHHLRNRDCERADSQCNFLSHYCCRIWQYE